MTRDPKPCPRCGATEGQQAVVYFGGAQRIVCGRCGATVRTFIRGTDFALAGVIVSVVACWFLLKP